MRWPVVLSNMLCIDHLLSCCENVWNTEPTLFIFIRDGVCQPAKQGKGCKIYYKTFHNGIAVKLSLFCIKFINPRIYRGHKDTLGDSLFRLLKFGALAFLLLSFEMAVFKMIQLHYSVFVFPGWHPSVKYYKTWNAGCWLLLLLSAFPVHLVWGSWISLTTWTLKVRGGPRVSHDHYSYRYYYKCNEQICLCLLPPPLPSSPPPSPPPPDLVSLWVESTVLHSTVC